MTDSAQTHGHSTTIIVNGRPVVFNQDEISYEQVVGLAFEVPPAGPNTMITVTYRRGHGNKPDGTLVSGQTVKVKDEMIFNAIATDKS